MSFRWAAIASYLPERTDNDIKNYWNTHLKKKLKKLHFATELDASLLVCNKLPRNQWERRLQADIKTAKQALSDALSPEKSTLFLTPPSPEPEEHNKPLQPPIYASSTDNIAKLLKGWVKKSPKATQSSSKLPTTKGSIQGTTESSSSNEDTSLNYSDGFEMQESFESILGLEPFDDQPMMDLGFSESRLIEIGDVQVEANMNSQLPLSLLEKWLFDDGVSNGKEFLGGLLLDNEDTNFI